MKTESAICTNCCNFSFGFSELSSSAIKSKIISSFSEALNVISYNEFNLIIVDIKNNNKNSLNFLKGNAIDPVNSIPAIAITRFGKNQIPDLEKLIQDKITKPLKTQSIYNTLDKFQKKFLHS